MNTSKEQQADNDSKQRGGAQASDTDDDDYVSEYFDPPLTGEATFKALVTQLNPFFGLILQRTRMQSSRSNPALRAKLTELDKQFASEWYHCGDWNDSGEPSPTYREDWNLASAYYEKCVSVREASAVQTAERRRLYQLGETALLVLKPNKPLAESSLKLQEYIHSSTQLLFEDPNGTGDIPELLDIVPDPSLWPTEWPKPPTEWRKPLEPFESHMDKAKSGDQGSSG